MWSFNSCEILETTPLNQLDVIISITADHIFCFFASILTKCESQLEKKFQLENQFWIYVPPFLISEKNLFCSRWILNREEESSIFFLSGFFSKSKLEVRIDPTKFFNLRSKNKRLLAFGLWPRAIFSLRPLLRPKSLLIIFTSTFGKSSLKVLWTSHKMLISREKFLLYLKISSIQRVGYLTRMKIPCGRLLDVQSVDLHFECWFSVYKQTIAWPAMHWAK